MINPSPTSAPAPETDTLQLQELHALPPGLLECESHELADALGGPTLIHLPGQREPALFVSVLMHGNETVGWETMRALLKRHAGDGRPLPRALSLFIGNVRAAALGQRTLPGQPDYNRVWPGTELPETPVHRLMADVVERMRSRGIFASIDLHNNTGANPHYACVNVIDNRFLHLATLFSRTVVYFVRPTGVQSQAMAHLCPAVTLECGKVEDRRGVDHALELVDACLHLSHLPEQAVAAHDIDLYHTVVQVKIPAELPFGFAPEDAPLMLSPDLDHMNFRELPAGTAFGRCWADDQTKASALLDVRDEWDRLVTDHYFGIDDGELRLKVPVMPSTLTRDETVIRQDCLCYLMERYNGHVPRRD